MSAFNPSILTPLLMTAVVGTLYYRRIRRQFGRQSYQPKRAMLRTAMMALILCGLLFSAFVLPHVAIAVVIGLLAGGAMGALALRHTHIETTDGQGWYTPNPWIGGALSLLLVGRLAWRWSQGGFGAGAQAAQNASPLTLGILATLVAYYLVSGAGLVWRMRELQLTAGPSTP
jgi:hypothetical protein